MAIYCHLTWLNWVLELAMTSLLCRHDPTVLIECLQNSGYFNIVHIAKSIFPAYLLNLPLGAGQIQGLSYS